MTMTTGEDSRFSDEFHHETLALMLGKTSGNLWPYIYGAPQEKDDPVRGGILYNQMLAKEKEYYLYEKESDLFKTKGKDIASLVGSGATFIELGPGSEQSLRLKTLPLLKACSDLKGYVGIDISQSFLDKGLEVIRSELPKIMIQGIQQDFTRLENLPKFERTVVFFKGSTIANLRKDELPDFIADIKRLAGDGHLLLLVHDSNQDERSLMQAYDNSGMAVFMANIMYRIKRDADAAGLRPEKFYYQPVWKPKSHDLQHVLTATEAQHVTIDGKTVEIKKGQKFHTLSSFKYPVEVFQKMIGSAGYKPIAVFRDSSGRMAAHVFQG